ncbi:MAG: hypothetical protein ACRCSF_10820 [Mycobacteriaceae bacterium]
MALWRVRHMAVPVYSLALSLLILGPLFQPGYLLLRDAVSTPRSYLTDDALGLSEVPARAVPQDALLAVLSRFCDGGILVKGLLLLALLLAGCGAARMVLVLLPQVGLPGQFVAITLSLWNPYVAQRLLQGHWSLLLGYAALFWIVITALKIRDSTNRILWLQLGFWFAFAGITPSGAILATIVGLLILAPRPSRLLSGACLSLVAGAPWLVVSFVHNSGLSHSDPAGVIAFAARAEPGLGTLGSLAGLGGIWNAEAEPYSRTTLFALFSTGILLFIVALGAPIVCKKARHPISALLCALAAVAILGPAVFATNFGLEVGQWVVQHIPGTGLFRDSQKWVALALPFYVLAGSAATLTLKRYLPSSVNACLLCLALFVSLPDLFWGVNGMLKPIDYPQGWGTVRQKISAEPGDVAVLPTGMFRRYAWNHYKTALDPTSRLVPADVLNTGELTVSGVTVNGESSRALQVEKILLEGGPVTGLQQLGLKWILVQFNTSGIHGNSPKTLNTLPLIYSDNDLALYYVGGSNQLTEKYSRSKVLSVIAHILWASILTSGVAVGITRIALQLRRRRSLQT